MIKNGYALERIEDEVELQWFETIPSRIDIPEALIVLFSAQPDFNDGKYRIVSRDKEFPDPEPQRRLISKSLVLDRLTDEQLAAALGLMSQRQKERWRSPDKPAVFADDTELLAVLAAVGADPAVVLA